MGQVLQLLKFCYLSLKSTLRTLKLVILAQVQLLVVLPSIFSSLSPSVSMLFQMVKCDISSIFVYSSSQLSSQFLPMSGCTLFLQSSQLVKWNSGKPLSHYCSSQSVLVLHIWLINGYFSINICQRNTVWVNVVSLFKLKLSKNSSSTAEIICRSLVNSVRSTPTLLWTIWNQWPVKRSSTVGLNPVHTTVTKHARR